MLQSRTEESTPHACVMSLDGVVLPLTETRFLADAKAGLALVTIVQRFVNPHAEPLSVRYQLPLPADAAVSGFAFTVDDRRVVGRVEKKQVARQQFEDAVLEGRSAALLEQERSSLFTQELGNVPPGASLLCEVQLDVRLAYLPEGSWELRLPTVAAPRYLSQVGATEPSTPVTVADRPTAVALGLELTVRDDVVGPPSSPSHALSCQARAGVQEVRLAQANAGLDRDVVVRWPVATPSVGAALDVMRPGSGPLAQRAYGLLTLVPPSTQAQPRATARDLILLFDTSGSMGGEPLAQAQRVALALIDTLSAQDQLELVEFSTSARRWTAQPVSADEPTKADARRWVRGLRAAGGTEMRTGVLEALATVRAEAQRQVVVLTDGLIGQEQSVLQAIAERLPPGSRVHFVGVGSAVNRSLTQPAARLGRGVELVLSLGEDAEVAAKRIVARTSLPVVTQLSVEGTALVRSGAQRPADLYAQAPALLPLELDVNGGTLVLRGRTADGEFCQVLSVPPTLPGVGSPALAAVFGRERVEDLETERAVRGASAALDEQVEALGLGHQLATRLTSWVAISQNVTVDPRAPKRTQVMPQTLPFGLSAEGLGLRGAVSLGRMQAGLAAPPPPAPVSRMAPAKKVKLSERARGDFEAEESDRAAAPRGASGGPRFGLGASEPKADVGASDSFEKQEGTRRAERVVTPREEPADRDDTESVERKPAAAAKASGRLMQEAPAPRRLRGTLRRTAAGRWHLVFALPIDSQFSPPASVQVVTADGAHFLVSVDLGTSTAPGRWSAGLTVTIALLGEPPTGAREVELLVDGERWLVELAG